jgi:hypothetical protein
MAREKRKKKKRNRKRALISKYRRFLVIGIEIILKETNIFFHFQRDLTLMSAFIIHSVNIVNVFLKATNNLAPS